MSVVSGNHSKACKSALRGLGLNECFHASSLQKWSANLRRRILTYKQRHHENPHLSELPAACGHLLSRPTHSWTEASPGPNTNMHSSRLARSRNLRLPRRRLQTEVGQRTTLCRPLASIRRTASHVACAYLRWRATETSRTLDPSPQRVNSNPPIRGSQGKIQCVK